MEKMEKKKNKWYRVFLEHPVEVLLSVVFALAGCFHLGRGSGYDYLMAPITCFPMLFLLAYTMNALTAPDGLASGRRPLYYLSAFFFVPLLWAPAVDLWSPLYPVLFVLVQMICFFGCRKPGEGLAFLVMRYLKAAVLAAVIAGAVYLLVTRTYVALKGVFAIGDETDRWFLVQVAYWVFMCGMPILFILLNRRKEVEGDAGHALQGVMQNKVFALVLALCVALCVMFLILADLVLIYVSFP